MSLTLNLSDLCGCPGGDCPDCCSVDNPCCAVEGVPLTLFATIESAGCAVLDGLVLAMSYNSATAQWESGSPGPIVCDGFERLAAVLKCMGADCTGWFFAIGTQFKCGWGPPVIVSCTCSPFELVIDAAEQNNLPAPNECPCCGVGSGIRVTITA